MQKVAPALIAQVLSCGPSKHEATVSGVLAERSMLSKERKALQAEIAQLHAGHLVAQLDAQGELRSLTRKLRALAHVLLWPQLCLRSWLRTGVSFSMTCCHPKPI